MGTTAAIYYSQEGYDTGGKRLLGRQAAGEGFLKGLVQYGLAEYLYCYSATQREFEEFRHRIQPWFKTPRNSQWLPFDEPHRLREAGTLYWPTPGLSDLAWQRRYGDPRSYSLCGITHTTATQAVMQAIGDLLIAPVQSWDAIVCTSKAVKTQLEYLLGSWGDYLAQRTGGTPHTEVQLPVIPLGIDCSLFPQGQAAKELRRRWRQDLGIGKDEIAVLFVGRLIAHAKAHPVPQYIALEQAAQATGKKIHLIQSGWFEYPEHEADFKKSLAAFCPSVKGVFLDGRKQNVRSQIWSAADIFVSLAENIQETFGLTPIEAMAAGLPVVVSDWNGYKESVRDRVDGFKISTLISPPGSGFDLARRYFQESINYSTYIGQTASFTAIDVEACTQAFIELISQKELRQKMGENGRQRAKTIYDWQVIIPAYEALWEELAQRRASAPISVPLTAGMPPHPLADDPYRLFAHYPTQSLSDELVLKLGSMATPENFKKIWAFGFNKIGFRYRVSVETLEQILEEIADSGSLSVGELKRQFSNVSPVKLYRSLVYLVKFDILRINV